MISKSFGLYIHWPFCAVKCPYCDFNSHVRKHIPLDFYHQAFLQSLKQLHRKIPDFTLSSIFFGGGTPSMMPTNLTAEIIETACRLFTPSKNPIEITLEANPSDQAHFKNFRNAGINRLSLGIQSLDDNRLRFLGRNHNAKTAKKAIDLAHDSFDNISLDAIYACPGQHCEEWAQELDAFLSFHPDHLSLYQLSIEAGTPFATLSQKKIFHMPDADLQADFYDITASVLEKSPLKRYEISNHARNGKQSEHNMIYWRHGYYAGIGPGAHGRLPGEKNLYQEIIQKKIPESWVKDILSGGNGTASSREIKPDDAWKETLITGLRLQEGVDFSKLDYLMQGISLKLKSLPCYQNLIKGGFLYPDSSRLKLTMQGFLCLDYILRQFIFME